MTVTFIISTSVGSKNPSYQYNGFLPITFYEIGKYQHHLVFTP